MDSAPNKLDKDQKKILLDHVEESACIIGFKPITDAQLDTEAEAIRLDPTTTDKRDSRKIYNTAAVNLIMKFLKENLKMSEKDRNNLNINSIFQSKKDNPQILYIRCETPDDISLITSHLRYMEHSNLRSAPTTVTHIPKALFKRYQHCEKLIYKLRISKEKTIQTNLRLGRLDFQLRQREKGDLTQWKDLPILKIPANAPGPDMDLITDENEEIITDKLSSQLEEIENPKTGPSQMNLKTWNQHTCPTQMVQYPINSDTNTTCQEQIYQTLALKSPKLMQQTTQQQT